MSFYKNTCEEFTNKTFSKDPAPGGGGVAALAGALGIALGGMVCNLTAGKKKYEMYEEDIQRIIKDTEVLKDRFLKMMDEDAENFVPLSKAYSLPVGTDEEKAYKEKELDRCLKIAMTTPIDTIECAYKSIELFEELAIKGTKLALSDVGCGATLIRSTLSMGLLNVVANLNMIKDEEYVRNIKAEIYPLVEKGIEKCDKIFVDVLNTI